MDIIHGTKGLLALLEENFIKRHRFISLRFFLNAKRIRKIMFYFAIRVFSCHLPKGNLTYDGSDIPLVPTLNGLATFYSFNTMITNDKILLHFRLFN